MTAAQTHLLRCSLGQRPLRASSRVRASHLHLWRLPSFVAYPTVSSVRQAALQFRTEPLVRLETPRLTHRTNPLPQSRTVTLANLQFDHARNQYVRQRFSRAACACEESLVPAASTTLQCVVAKRPGRSPPDTGSAAGLALGTDGYSRRLARKTTPEFKNQAKGIHPANPGRKPVWIGRSCPRRMWLMVELRSLTSSAI